MTIFDGTKQDILDAVTSGHVSEEDARDEFAVRHAEGKEGYEDYAAAEPTSESHPAPSPDAGDSETEHDAPEVEYTGGDAELHVEPSA